MIKDLSNLSWVALRIHHDLITDLNTTLLDLAVSNDTLLLNSFENRHSEGSIGISILDWQVIKDLKKSFTLIPRTGLGVNFLLDVVAGQTRNRNIIDIFGRIARLFKERLEFSSNFGPSFLLPLNRRLVHLVDDNDELLNTQTLGELNVFAGLTIFLETSFEFTSSG